MDRDWTLYFFMFVIGSIVMGRLDRLGKHIEAVSASIRADIARTEQERDEIINEWREYQKQVKRDAWQFWGFWSAVGVAGLLWWVITQHN